MAGETKKIIEALWDCPYCGAKGIGGLTKVCPSCGHPQDAGTKFYMGDKKAYVEGDKAANYGKGADWTCAYCGALNRYDAAECSGCGAAREESQSDYFQNQKENARKAQEEAAREQQFTAPQPTPAPQKKKVKSKKKLLIALGAAALLLVLLIALLIPKAATAEVSGKAWQRSISIEQYTTVTETDWSIPEGGRIREQHEEIHHYNQVLDHYETVAVEKSRQVQDGYDTETDYEDNGDGTFTETTREVPRYKTEYYTEYEEEPVYLSVPVYATQYTYEIERWLPGRTADSEGNDDAPYWQDFTLLDNEREGTRSEQYTVTLTGKKGKTYSVNLTESLWNSLMTGKSVKIKATGSKVTEIDGTKIG